MNPKKIQDFMAHVSANPNQKLMLYVNHFASTPGLDNFINTKIKNQFPEVHQQLQNNVNVHKQIMNHMSKTSDMSNSPFMIQNNENF